MKRHNWISHAAVIVFLASNTVQAPGQKMNVKIIQRQNSESEYTYVVPGHFNSTSNTNLNCNTGSTNVNCTGRTTTSGTSTEPREISYRVAGVTFSLLLPDGRVTVVNCEGKPLSVWGNGGPGRAVSTGERPLAQLSYAAGRRYSGRVQGQERQTHLAGERRRQEV
jgi:hypothetical protein